MKSISNNFHGEHLSPFFLHRCRMFVVFMLLGLCLYPACANQYQYPSHLFQRTIKFEDYVTREPRTVGEHSCCLDLEKIDGKYLPSGPSPELLLHYCKKDGSDVTVKSYKWSGGIHYKKKGKIDEIESVKFIWWITTDIHSSKSIIIDDAQLGDVTRCYILCDNGDSSWVSQEFGIRCGGKGQHSHCDQCFMPVPVPKNKTLGETTAERLKKIEQGVQKPDDPKVAATHTPLSSRTADELVGQELRLQSDIVIYSLAALPRPEAMGELKADMTLQVVRTLSPTLLHVKFTTSNGHTYEGVAKLSSLQQTVPVTPLTAP